MLVTVKFALIRHSCSFVAGVDSYWQAFITTQVRPNRTINMAQRAGVRRYCHRMLISEGRLVNYEYIVKKLEAFGCLR